MVKPFPPSFPSNPAPLQTYQEDGNSTLFQFLNHASGGWFRKEVRLSDEFPIKRLSGATFWTPAEITTALWLDASDTSTISLNGGDVSAWNDKSGNSRHFTEATASEQPIYDAASLNGLATIRSSVPGESLGAAAPITCGSIFLVTKHATGTSTNTEFLIGDADGVTRFYHFHGDDTDPRTNLFAGGYGGAVAGDSQTRVNGNTAVASDSALKPTAWTILSMPYFYLGGTYQFSSLGYDNNNRLLRTWIGSYAEVIALPATATQDQYERIEGYLAHKWGLTADLPGGHPYKSIRPPL